MTFSEVALLKTNAGTTDKELCEVLGYIDPGDGGGGVFFWDADSTKDEDNGIVF